MSNLFSGMKSWWLIVAGAALAVLVLVWLFFPQIIQQMALGVVALFTFLIGLLFKRKKGA